MPRKIAVKLTLPYELSEKIRLHLKPKGISLSGLVGMLLDQYWLEVEGSGFLDKRPDQISLKQVVD